MDPRTGIPVVGMVGGGQLARMTHQAAIPLGQSLRVLCVSEDDPAARVTRDYVLGHHTDLEALRAFAAGCDVITFDHEHVPNEHLRVLVEAGVKVHPGPEALLHAQDKLVMRNKLGELGLPVPPFSPVKQVDDVLGFGARFGWPAVLKAARGGYDGRGVWMLDSPADAERLVGELLDAGTSLLVEQCVPLRREFAALIARSPFGQGAAWPLVQTVQREGICVEVLAPAPEVHPELAASAQELALRVADELGVVGVLAVELFDTDAGVLVNELAMRPHNSGHWTMDGALTSQFEQHLRAVLDYPLGATDPVAPAVVMANVLGAPQTPAMSVDERLHHLFARFPDVHAHLYGKAERPGRKVGHVNVLGERMEDVREKARLAAHWLSHAEWLDGYRIH
ncbi:5-(carboxyamino)imidazole ribonucleotide synthase [Longimycelium tulufanense]|uniref:5-(carboxyamino)imidazole ribonucleotide synthase n=1 Tax=Longimycelium tulufanense TaxID=907463 RepID=UPI001669E193|nr:5-(carboxyamino)imidazole ribonucleotide synthase [Longimycelium tulufanense]